MTSTLKRTCGLVLSILLIAAVGCGAPTTPKRSASPRVSKKSAAPAQPAPQKEPATSSAASSAAEAPAPGGWGDLTGVFVFDGTAPEQGALQVTKDVEFCGKFNPPDESLVVNKENNGVANVVVYLYQRRGEEPPAVHESYAETAEAEVVLDNKECRFEPHIQLLRTTQKLIVRNSDEVGHNTKVEALENSAINPIVPAGGSTEAAFPEPERLPISVSCSIHPWMTARLVVRDNPYFAVSDQDGRFEIKNLPTGEWTFQVWHEKAGYVQEVTMGGEQIEWNRGRMTAAVGEGSNDLGEIKLSASVFEN